MVSIRPEEQNGVSQLRYVKYDSDTMAGIDTEQERKRLQRVYSGMTEGELRALAEDAVSLTPDAVQALSADLARRELDIAVSTSDDESGVPPEELVTIRSFRGIPEAMLAKGMLDSAGIQCFVVDDNTGRMFGPNTVGGIRMQVNSADANAAMELLMQSTSEDSHEVLEKPPEQRDDETPASSGPSWPSVVEKPPHMAVSQRQRLVGLAIVLTVSFLPSVTASILRVGGLYPDYPDALTRYSYFNYILKELTALALLAYVVRQNRQSLSDLGLGFRRGDVFHGLLLWGGARWCYRLSSPAILSFCELLGWHRTEPYIPSLKLGFGLLTLCLVLVNPIFEELTVRAFLMTETVALSGSSALAIVSSVLLQTSYHLYQGLPYALALGVIFLIFSLYYAHTRRILPLILAHFILDLFPHVEYALHQAHSGHP